MVGGGQREDRVLTKSSECGELRQAAALPRGSPQECNPAQGTAAGDARGQEGGANTGQ